MSKVCKNSAPRIILGMRMIAHHSSPSLIYDQAHPNIFQSTFNFSEFVSTCQKPDFFILFFLF